MAYAEGTSVDSERSRAEIERTIRHYGATGFVYATNDETRTAIIGFMIYKRQVRFALPLPNVNDDRFRLTPTRGTLRTRPAQLAAYEQEVRRSWRSLALVIKAKLAAVEDGIVEFDREFLAHLVVPGGTTVWDEIRPNLQATLEGGDPSDLMPRAITRGQG